MAAPTGQPKTMSNRLATMKFMQRAGSSPSSAPSTPGNRSDGPPSKKVRLSTGSFNGSPVSTPNTGFQSAEKQQQESPATNTQDAGETKWYLSVKRPDVGNSAEIPFNVVNAGYSSLDTDGRRQDDSSEEDNASVAKPKLVGRRSFGKFNKTIERRQNPEAQPSDSGESSSESEGDDSDLSDDDGDDPTGAKAMIAESRKAAAENARQERRAKRKAEKAEAERLASERRKKTINMNARLPTSGGISSGGGSKSSASDMTCFACGDKGHAKRDCPRSRSGGKGRGERR